MAQDLDAQLVFDDAQVLVKGAEHADDVLHALDFDAFIYHVISFRRLSRLPWQYSLYSVPAA